MLLGIHFTSNLLHMLMPKCNIVPNHRAFLTCFLTWLNCDCFNYFLKSIKPFSKKGEIFFTLLCHISRNTEKAWGRNLYSHLPKYLFFWHFLFNKYIEFFSFLENCSFLDENVKLATFSRVTPFF